MEHLMFQFDEASLNSTDSSVPTTVSSVRTITDGSNASNAPSLNGIQIPQRDSTGIYEDHPGLNPTDERIVELQGAIHEVMGRLMQGRDPADVLAAAERVHGESNNLAFLRGQLQDLEAYGRESEAFRIGVESPLDQFSIPLEFFFSISLSILLALGLVLLLIRWRNDRLFLFAAILSICALSSKQISIYNEEMIVARCFIGFLIFSRKSFGKTFQETLDGRIESIQEELQQFFNPNEVIPEESNEQQRLLRISLRICSTVVESLPTARCAPKCEKTVQALLCRNLNVKSATLLNATSSRRIRLQDDIVTGFHFSVSERFLSGSTFKASTVEEIREAFVPIDLIREGLIVLRKVRVGGSILEE
jgi:ATP synthase B subunit